MRLNFLCIAEATIAAFAVPGDFAIKGKMIEIYKYSIEVHVSRATLKIATIKNQHNIGISGNPAQTQLREGRGGGGQGGRREGCKAVTCFTFV